MRSRLSAPAFFLVLLLALAPCCAAAGEEKASGGGEGERRASEPEREPARSKKTKAEAVPLYTNEDLERMFGPSGASEAKKEETGRAEPSRAPGGGARPEGPEAARRDPLEAIEQEQAREADRSLRLAKAEREVAEAAARVKELEKRALAIRNPFLPRPELPPEEAEAWKGLSNEQRLERTEAALAQARKKLEEARARLAALQ